MIAVVAFDPADDPVAEVPALATLVSREEVTVVCGYSSAQRLMTQLRQWLPRFEFIGLLTCAPMDDELRMIDSLLARGAVPVAVTADHDIRDTAALITRHLNGSPARQFDTRLAGIVT